MPLGALVLLQNSILRCFQNDIYLFKISLFVADVFIVDGIFYVHDNFLVNAMCYDKPWATSSGTKVRTIVTKVKVATK